jgi:hypothetical protein
VHPLKFGDQSFQVLDLGDVFRQLPPKAGNYDGIFRGVGGG